MNAPDKPGAHNPDESRLDFGRVLPLVALLLVVVFGGYAYFASTIKNKETQEQLAEQTGQNMELQKQMANMQTMMEDLKTAKVYEEQEKSISATNALSVIERGELLQSQIDELALKLNALNKALSDLEQNAVGKKIAANQDLLTQFSAVKEITLPNSGLPNHITNRLEQVLSAPKSALSQQVAGYVPSDALFQALSSMESETSDALLTVNQVRTEIDSFVTKAESLGEMSDQPLSDALHALNEKDLEQRRGLVSKSIEDAKREADQKLAEQEAENRLKIAEAERKAAEMVGEETAAKILADAAAIKAEIDEAKKIRDEAEAKAQHVREYNRDLPQIKQYLQAFLADGRKLRDSGSGPASLSYLVGKGALTPDNSGLEELLSLGAYYNDRPKGALPEFFYFNSVNVQGKNSKIDAIEKAQQFLIKYGELMVENGTLAK